MKRGMNNIKGIAVQDMEATLYGLGSGLKSLLHACCPFVGILLRLFVYTYTACVCYAGRQQRVNMVSGWTYDSTRHLYITGLHISLISPGSPCHAQAKITGEIEKYEKYNTYKHNVCVAEASKHIAIINLAKK